MSQLDPVITFFLENDGNISLVVYTDSTRTVRFDLTSSVLTFTVKAKETDTANLIQKTSASAAEIEITNAAQGEATIKLIPSDSEDLTQRAYVFDVRLVKAGKTYTIKKDYINFLQKIT